MTDRGRTEFRLQELLLKQTPQMSQSELARRSGVSLTTINALMLNKTRQVSLETLHSVSGVLGVAAGDLLSAPLCAICHTPVFDDRKVEDRSLYQVWCTRCGVYFVGSLSRAQLRSLTPEAQRLPLASAIHEANARGKIGVVWGEEVAAADDALDRMAGEIVDRFAIICQGHLLDCTRDLQAIGWGRPAQPSQQWLVQIDRTESHNSGIGAMNMTKAQAARAIQAWYLGKFGRTGGARRHR